MAFGYEDELKAEIARLRDALDEQTGRAAWHYECLIQRDAQVARLRLTDAEREAVEVAARFMDKWGGVPNTIASATLRGLLERMGDCPASDNAADRDSGTTGSV